MTRGKNKQGAAERPEFGTSCFVMVRRLRVVPMHRNPPRTCSAFMSALPPCTPCGSIRCAYSGPLRPIEGRCRFPGMPSSWSSPQSQKGPRDPARHVFTRAQGTCLRPTLNCLWPRLARAPESHRRRDRLEVQHFEVRAIHPVHIMLVAVRSRVRQRKMKKLAYRRRWALCRPPNCWSASAPPYWAAS